MNIMNINNFDLKYTELIHEEKLREYFGKDINLTGQKLSGVSSIPVLLMVFHNRSGSNLIGDMLGQTGLYVSAGECFNFDFVIEACNKHKITEFDQYIKGLLVDMHKDGKIVVIKVSPDQLCFLTKIGVIGHAIKNVQFVYSNRRNKLMQAVSHFLAKKTGVWSVTKNSANAELNMSYITNNYSKDVVCEEILGIIAHNIEMERLAKEYFSRFVSNFRTVYYEDFEKQGNYEVLAALLRWLGVDSLAIPEKIEPCLKMQRKNINFDIADMFMSWAESSPKYKSFSQAYSVDIERGEPAPKFGQPDK